MTQIPPNDRFATFSRYLMNESLAPLKTPYGVNKEFNDYHYANDTANHLIYTFFTDGQHYYCVFLYTNDGEVAFGTTDTPSTNYLDYQVNRKGTGRGIYVFNKFMFIILSIANNLKTPILKFESADKELGSVYDRAVTNKFLLQKVENYGYSYKGMSNDGLMHIFERIQK